MTSNPFSKTYNIIDLVTSLIVFALALVLSILIMMQGRNKPECKSVLNLVVIITIIVVGLLIVIFSGLKYWSGPGIVDPNKGVTPATTTPATTPSKDGFTTKHLEKHFLPIEEKVEVRKIISDNNNDLWKSSGTVNAVDLQDIANLSNKAGDLMPKGDYKYGPGASYEDTNENHNPQSSNPFNITTFLTTKKNISTDVRGDIPIQDDNNFGINQSSYNSSINHRTPHIKDV